MRKTLTRLLIGLIAIPVLLIVGVLISIGIDSALMGGRVAVLTNTDIPNPEGGTIRAYVARPKTAGPHPAVIMVHEFWGATKDINDKADALAAEGYVVVARDAFRGRTTSWLPGAIYNVVSVPAEQVDQDMTAVFKWLEQQQDVLPNKIGITGFCFGGRTAINQAVSNRGIAATAVFYGSPVTEPAKLKGLGPVLGVFGGADSSIPVDSVKSFETALNVAGVTNEITIYAGQPHAFVVDMAAVRSGGPAGEAWAQMLRFFKANLKDGASTQRPVPASGRASEHELAYLFRLAFEHATMTHAH